MAEVSNELIMTAIEGEDIVVHHTAYFAAAEGFMRGARLLAKAEAPPSDSAPALALLSGQILECLLKAFLSKVGGVREDDLKKKFGHELSKLWQCAETLGLPIGPVPEWATSLNSLHADPYYLRYPRNGLGFPNAQHNMMLKLTTLLETVRERMG
jgi:hypothetical protein